MKSIIRITLLLALLIVAPAAGISAQDDVQAQTLPVSHTLSGVGFEPQWWNNCGPATLTNALIYFGYADDQGRAANFLKPDSQDKNVTPQEMVEFVNTQVPELPVFAIHRVGGTIDLMRTLIANDFPVIIEEGYDPEPDRLGWMGHYLLLRGYDDSVGVFMTSDSYLGSVNYSYDHINTYWRHFNRNYIVLYTADREAELMEILGDDADELTNYINALSMSIAEAEANEADPFAWFNLGTNYLRIADLYPDREAAVTYYQYAAASFDRARNAGNGLPWRMLWYQFGPFEAYNAVGRYGDTIALARATIATKAASDEYLNVEEVYYYAGVAREALGERDNAIANYSTAALLNPRYALANEALARIRGG